MISEAIVYLEGQVLMVKQYVQRGDIVWNFPGGGVQENESLEEACKREVFEETGYEIDIIYKLIDTDSKVTFVGEIKSGMLFVDHNNKDNEDIIDAKWVSISDLEKFDGVTLPTLQKFLSQFKVAYK
jgi:8-oxo-dGTP diphosphatase